MSGVTQASAAREGMARGARRQLKDAGYIEQEYILRGTADLFTYDDAWNTVPRRQGLPYTTRVLVRRPADAARFSGDAVIEPLHPSGDMPSAWPRTGRTILRERMAFVGVTQDVAGLTATKALDADRYAELSIPEPGLGYDIVAQVASWLRSDAGPLQGLRHLFMTGASYTGTHQRVFLNDGFHRRARRPDGGPAVEGYLIQISSGAFMLGGYTPLSRKTPVPPAGDSRRMAQPCDVPIIELLSEGEAETHTASLRDDSDAADDRYRLYQVPGACHMTSSEAGPLALPIVEQPSDFPMDAFAGGALVNLRRWALSGTPPPRAGRMTLLADRAAGPCGLRDEALPLKRDRFGNAVGGVRSPFVDVPAATYYPHSTLKPVGPLRADARRDRRLRPEDVADLMGHMRPFPPAQLRELYGTRERYRDAFGEGVEALIDARWIDARDGEHMREMAACVEL